MDIYEIIFDAPTGASSGGGGGGSSLLLDTYSGAAAAYSLRKLRTAYAGSAIRVRRSSDSAEQDIGFTAGRDLDTTALLAFCGASDGFVTTWYDQSGNTRNFSQVIAGQQPRIVSSGVVVAAGGKPSIDFLGTRTLSTLSGSFTSALSAFGLFCVTSPGVGSGYRGMFSPDSSASSLLLLKIGGTTWGTFGSTDEPSSTPFSARSLLEMHSSNGNSGSFSLNNASAGSFTSTIGQTPNIGGKAGQEYDGSIQELIYYESSQASNRTAIASNINTYYGIY